MPLERKFVFYPTSGQSRVRQLRQADPATRNSREAKVRVNYDVTNPLAQKKEMEKVRLVLSLVVARSDHRHRQLEIDVVRGDARRDAEERKLSARTGRSVLTAEFLEEGAGEPYDEEEASEDSEAEDALEARRRRQRAAGPPSYARTASADSLTPGSKRAATVRGLVVWPDARADTRLGGRGIRAATVIGPQGPANRAGGRGRRRVKSAHRPNRKRLNNYNN
jgi:hypothetical protein